ncbi:MAG: DMT family transporter [Paracoccaceae bacterium]
MTQAAQAEAAAPRGSLVAAVVILLCGIVCLDSMNVFVRLLLERYSTVELTAYRNTIGMVPSLIYLWWAGELKGGVARLKLRQWPLGLSRGVMVAVAQLCYYLALGHMEFATAAALVYTLSLFTVALSIPILGERVGPWRWGAVLLGFAGAMLILRPGTQAFQLYAAFPLIAAFFYALTIVTARRIDAEVSSAVIYLYSSVAAAVCMVGYALLTGAFSPIALNGDLIMITAMGLCGGTGVLLLLIAVRKASPSVLAPFNYFGMISAFVLGWVVFGEAPFSTLFPGVLLIVGAGLLILWRERRKRGT